jgi:hypothetical protein
MYVLYIFFIKSIVPLLAPNKVNGGQIISYNLYF